MLFPKIKGIKSFSSVYQALQACYRRHSFPTLDGVDYEAIFVRDIIMIHHLKKMKNYAIVCNITHFETQIDIQGLNYPGIERIKY